MISSDVVVATTQASSQVTNPVGLALLGLVFVLLGLPLVIKPRRMARPPKWQFKNPEQVEPSDFTVDLVRIGGIVWTLGGVAIIIIAFVA